MAQLFKWLQRIALNSLPSSGDFCHLLITFANSLDPDQARQNVRPDLEILMVLKKKSAFKKVKYGTIIKREGIIKALLENSKADHNTLFRRYVIFELPRVYF